MQHSERELMRLVAIGALSNGRVLYMPLPEVELICECFAPRDASAFRPYLNIRELRAIDACFAVFVRDQQRVYDAIVHGVAAPFEPRDLPTFAQILRYS